MNLFHHKKLGKFIGTPNPNQCPNHTMGRGVILPTEPWQKGKKIKVAFGTWYGKKLPEKARFFSANWKDCELKKKNRENV